MERAKERKGEPGRENGNMTDKKKKREEVAKVTKQAQRMN